MCTLLIRDTTEPSLPNASPQCIFCTTSNPLTTLAKHGSASSLKIWLSCPPESKVEYK